MDYKDEMRELIDIIKQQASNSNHLQHL